MWFVYSCIHHGAQAGVGTTGAAALRGRQMKRRRLTDGTSTTPSRACEWASLHLSSRAAWEEGLPKRCHPSLERRRGRRHRYVLGRRRLPRMIVWQHRSCQGRAPRCCGRDALRKARQAMNMNQNQWRAVVGRHSRAAAPTRRRSSRRSRALPHRRRAGRRAGRRVPHVPNVPRGLGAPH